MQTGKVRVYNIESGEHADCFPVDAKEYVATGKWSYERPEKAPEGGGKPPKTPEGGKAPAAPKATKGGAKRAKGNE